MRRISTLSQAGWAETDSEQTCPRRCLAVVYKAAQMTLGVPQRAHGTLTYTMTHSAISSDLLFPPASQKQLFVYQNWCVSVRETMAHKGIMAGLWPCQRWLFQCIFTGSEGCAQRLCLLCFTFNKPLWKEVECNLGHAHYPTYFFFPSFHILQKFRWYPGPRKKVKPYQGLYLRNEHAAACTWIFSLSQCPNEVSDCIWPAYLPFHAPK